MGYFPNGTSSEIYQSEFCDRCRHDSDERGCPIWFLHLRDNYKECNNKESYLHTLIPRDKEGWNDQCTMFVKR